MASPPTRTNVLVLLLLPLPLQPSCETALWPRRSTRTSVGLSLLLRPRTMPETVVPSGGRLARQCPLLATATPTSAPVSLRSPGSRHTEFLEPGTPTQTGCLRHRLHATLIKQAPGMWSQGSSFDCVAARRLLMHVTLSSSCLRLSALTFPCDAHRRSWNADVHVCFCFYYFGTVFTLVFFPLDC